MGQIEEIHTPPSPLERVGALDQSHRAFIDAVGKLRDSVNAETIKHARQCEDELMEQVRGLLTERFFQDSNHPMTTEMCIAALETSGYELSYATERLRPDSDKAGLAKFQSDLPSQLTEALHTGDYTEFMTPATKEMLDRIDDDDEKELFQENFAPVVIKLVWDTYSQIVREYAEAHLDSEAIRNFAQDYQGRLGETITEEPEKPERLLKAKLLAAVCAAAFAGVVAGSALADRLQKREK